MYNSVGKKSEANIRFLTINTILAKTDNFSLEEIIKELESKGINIEHMAEDCIEDLMDSGLIYEIGRKYKVRNRQQRWHMM